MKLDKRKSGLRAWVLVARLQNAASLRMHLRVPVLVLLRIVLVLHLLRVQQVHLVELRGMLHYIGV